MVVPHCCHSEVSKLDGGDVGCNVVVVTDGLGSWLDTLREHRSRCVRDL